MTDKELAQYALDARSKAYAPYSHYQVGAALLTSDHQIYTGCNIENASFGATNCAERTAFYKAISDGKRDFIGIAIAGGLEKQDITSFAFPCGICRQVMQEFCSSDFKIIMVKSINELQVNTLSELLPFGFGQGEMV